MNNEKKKNTLLFDKIPEYKKDLLAAATFNAVKEFLKKQEEKNSLKIQTVQTEKELNR